VYPSDANFLLIDSPAADEVLARVRGVGLIIRDVRQPLLPQALRISIGTPEQNALLLRSLA
jgi:histidinol-phosphate aminotransferase